MAALEGRHGLSAISFFPHPLPGAKKKDAASIPDAIKGEYLKRRFYQSIINS